MKKAEQSLEGLVEFLVRATAAWGGGPEHVPGLSAVPGPIAPSAAEYGQFLELWHYLRHSPSAMLRLGGERSSLRMVGNRVVLAGEEPGGEVSLGARPCQLPEAGWGEPPALLRLLKREPEVPDPSLEHPVFPFSPSPEQQEAAQMLARKPVAVIHGGPGTGKTRLAANLVAHYVCQGRRVLVAAPQEAALGPMHALIGDLAQPPGLGNSIEHERQADALMPRLVEISEKLWLAHVALFDAVQDEYEPVAGLPVDAAALAVRELRDTHGWAP
ncbi:MAG: AAA family ATPase, partial [Candidatus Eremiobacterota bacterium]